MDYSAEVRQRFSAPVRAGEVLQGTGPVLQGAAEDRSLGIWVRFQVQYQGANIERVRFRAYGCPHTLAAADLLAGRLEGKPLEALVSVDLDALARQLELPREKHGKLLRLEDALAACHAQALRVGQE